MKKYLLFVVLFYSVIVKAQLAGSSKIAFKDQAAMRLNTHHFLYNPSKGIELYLKGAEQGDATSMNALAVLYSEGVVVKVDYEVGFKWFEKAAKAGYQNSWYNLGYMYRKGLGIKQDFSKAFECFSKGTDAKSASSMYAKGYMLYKGLGCKQDYPQAVKLFKQSSIKGITSSKYMLGLCYRNGYGITVNIDSARYWLGLAAKLGYQGAKDELISVNPEYIQSVNKVPLIVSKSNKNPPEGIEQKVTGSNLSGIYTGYVIRYDWSRSYVISKSKLKVNIESKYGVLTGIWQEENLSEIAIQARLTDSLVKFKNTAYSHNDHYRPVKSVLFEFKEATLHSAIQDDSIYLSGEIIQWDTEQNEPERPMLISLSRKNSNDNINSSVTLSNANTFSIDNISLENRVIAYPNPFESSLNLSFNMLKAGKASIKLFDAKGNNVYQTSLQLSQGRHVHNLLTNYPPGAYIIVLTIDGNTKSTTVIKH